MSRIEAAASVGFCRFLWVLFERGLYSRAPFIHFFSRCTALVNQLRYIPICLKLHKWYCCNGRNWQKNVLGKC